MQKHRQASKSCMNSWYSEYEWICKKTTAMVMPRLFLRAWQLFKSEFLYTKSLLAHAWAKIKLKELEGDIRRQQPPGWIYVSFRKMEEAFKHY